VARYPDDALCAPILEVLGYFLALSPLTMFVGVFDPFSANRR
jgi:hypothetical protein